MYIFLFTLVLVGCRSLSLLDQGDFNDFLQRASHSPKQSGDFGVFFVQQISQFGGQLSVSQIPEFKGSWYSESDNDGFAAQLYDVSFKKVESFMRQVYGKPIAIYTNETSGWAGLYGISNNVAVQFFDDTNGVGFICMQSHKQKQN